MRFDDGIFKAYDIRGIVPDQFDERFACALGRNLPDFLEADRVVVGHDARLSSPGLYAALCAGLAEAGADFSGVGLCPTELIYFAAAAEYGFDLGLMITASHNPPEYNGFKVVSSTGEPISGRPGLDAVRQRLAAEDEGRAVSRTIPPVLDLADDYVDFALTTVGIPDASGLRIVVDAGNGVGGLLWDWIEEAVGADVVRLNCVPDGRFPAHHPDPSKRENVLPLVDAVRAEGADLGLSYDGDADRLVAVLSDGHIVDGSEMIACLATRLLSEGDCRDFGVAQTTSRKALDYFAAHGRRPILVPVGHAKVKHAMREQPSLDFAGEDAGHYYYRAFFCCDSSLITTLHVLHLAAEGEMDRIVADLAAEWQRPATEPSFRFDSPASALAVCRKVAQACLARFGDTVEITCEKGGRIERECGPSDIDDCDGVRLDYEDWWMCVRPSGTEPIARLALEARTDRMLTERTEFLSDLFADPA
jgi:phosphomannomutase